MGFNVIVTIGPAVFNEEKLKLIDAIGPNIYRINGSHIENGLEVIKIADEIRNILPQAQIMVDLPGNKIRTSGVSIPVKFEKGHVFKLPAKEINYREFYLLLKPKYIIFANDSQYRLEVLSSNDSFIELLPHCDGILGNNKGLHVQGIHKELPFFFEKDKEIIKNAIKAKVDYVAFSFVRDREDVRQAKSMFAGPQQGKTKFIVKIETLAAVINLEDILTEADCILIDRGDLACDVGLINVPKYQEIIISTAKRNKKRIILATQFLKNMQYSAVPSIAEEIDLYNTIKKGIDGIQLSEETAIGKYPAECVQHVFEVYKSVAREEKTNSFKIKEGKS
ncbi:MAG: hypothetical protein HQL27_05560 [Candidatus Omnitrophica bacterium]|nr:hypothetical protein [Candidatus Omnitrophota bacterium]